LVDSQDPRTRIVLPFSSLEIQEFLIPAFDGRAPEAFAVGQRLLRDPAVVLDEDLPTIRLGGAPPRTDAGESLVEISAASPAVKLLRLDVQETASRSEAGVSDDASPP